MAEKEDRNTTVECELCAATVIVRTDHSGFWICPRCRSEIVNTEREVL